MTALSYALVTPTRNEARDLPRLAGCLHAQTVAPRAWVIVDTGSDDDTPEVAAALAAEHDRTTLIALPFDAGLGEATVVVHAFEAGLATLREAFDVVVKLDADVSFEPDYFERLLARFEEDPQLGIASGTCFEQQKGIWRERHVTADHVWGACRAYRTACLADVSPLEARMGWDGIDAFKAHAYGWRTSTFTEIVFRHHRPEGRRHGRWAGWQSRGHAAHYMGYRPTFLALRALHHARSDPFALALLHGWAAAAIRREPRCPDPRATALLRRQQRLRELPARRSETQGRRSGSPSPVS